MTPKPPSAVAALSKTFRSYRRHLLTLVFLGFFGALLDGIGINLVVPFISFLIGGADTLPGDIITSSIQHLFAFFDIPFKFRYLLILITALFLGRAATLVWFAYVRARIGADFMEKEMSYLLSATLSARWAFLLKQKAGYLQNTIFWDVKRAAALLDVFAQFIQSWSGFLVYLVIAVNISPLITSVTVVAGLIFLLFFRPLIRKTQLLGEDTSRTEKSLAQYFTEHLGGLKTIKSAGIEKMVYGVGQKTLHHLQEVYTRSALVQTLGTVLIQPFSFIFMMAVFAFTYSTGTFSLPAFIATFYLIQKIFTYLQSGQTTIHSINELLPFAKNITAFKTKIREEREPVQEGGRSFSLRKDIVFRDVSLSYTDKPVLKNITFSITHGQTVALIGPSGAGKTSVADMLLRFFEPMGGSIEVDGVPLVDISLEDWRSRIGYVTQDALLLNLSIEDNVRFYRDNLSQKDIERALKQANIYDFVSSLPQGLHTLVGDRGVMLSGGQRQRLALARVLAGKPEILILDEATSALDTESERLIQESITALHGVVTVIIIAHRLSTVAEADTIIVLEDGRIVENDSPETLLKNPNSYFTRHFQAQQS
jgi:subfamily B ATP-binding cassette protein MsbA